MKKGGFWTILGILLFLAAIYVLVKNSDFVTALLKKSGVWAPLVATLIYPLFAPTPIITDPVTVIIGVTYGPVVGVTIALIGNTLAALVEYYLGTRINKATNFEKNKTKLPFGLGRMPVDSPVFLIGGRTIPGFGGKIISVLAGTYKVPIRTYLWTTLTTNLIGSMILAFGASGLVNLLRLSKMFG